MLWLGGGSVEARRGPSVMVYSGMGSRIASLLLHEIVHKRQFEINNTISYAIKYATNYLLKRGYYNIDAERQAFLLQSIYDMEMPEGTFDNTILLFNNKDLKNEK